MWLIITFSYYKDIYLRIFLFFSRQIVKSSVCVNANVPGGSGIASTGVCVSFSREDEKAMPTGGGEKDAGRL